MVSLSSASMATKNVAWKASEKEPTETDAETAKGRAMVARVSPVTRYACARLTCSAAIIMLTNSSRSEAVTETASAKLGAHMVYCA